MGLLLEWCLYKHYKVFDKGKFIKFLAALKND